MKKSLLVFALLAAVDVYAQPLQTSDLVLIAAKLRLPTSNEYQKRLYNFTEFSLIRLRTEGLCYQLKGGTDSYRTYGSGFVEIGNQTAGAARNTYSADGIYFKPGWIFARINAQSYAAYFSLNTNATLTRHLVEVTVDDRVYGPQHTAYERVTIFPFSSFELEQGHLFALGNALFCNLSLYIGYRTWYPYLFNDVLPGYGQVANFVPGVIAGGAFYINCQLGLGFRLYSAKN